MPCHRIAAKLLVLSALSILPLGPGRILIPADPAPARPSATLDRPADWTRLLYVREEGSHWSLCSAAADYSDPVFYQAGLAIESTARMSPDRSAIVYAAKSGDDLDLFRLALSAPPVVTQLTENDNEDRNPDWSPDGTAVIFDSTRQMDTGIYRVDAGGVSPLIDDGRFIERQPVWSPDGRRITYISSRNSYDQVWTADPDGKNAVGLSTRREAAWPAWSPDGEWIAYTADEDWDNYWELWRIPAAGGVSQLLYDGSSADEPGLAATVANPVWSPQGDRLAFNLVTQDGNDYQQDRSRIAVYSFTTSQTEVISPPGEDVRVTDWYSGDAPDVFVHLSLPGAVQWNQAFQAQITYGNQGRLAAGSVHLELAFPAGISAISAAAGRANGAGLEWDLGSLAANSQASPLTLVFQADGGQVGELVFSAVISSTPPDPYPENNSATGRMELAWLNFLPALLR